MQTTSETNQPTRNRAWRNVALCVFLSIPLAIIMASVHLELGTSKFWRPMISGGVIGGTSTLLFFYLNWKQSRRR